MSMFRDLRDTAQKWKQLDPMPGPTPRPLVGNLLALPRPWPKTFLRDALVYGPVLRYRILFRPIVVVADPALAAQVLSTRAANYVKEPVTWKALSPLIGRTPVTHLEGTAWLTRRRQLEPLLATARTQELTQLIVAETARWLRRLESEPRAIDLVVEVERLILNLLGKLFLGHDFGDYTARISDAFRVATTELERRAFLALPRWLRTLTPSNQRLTDALGYLKQVARERVLDAKRDPQPHSLITALLSAQPSDPTLTDETIAGELLAFLFAAHEPTAQAITLACALLAENPRIQRRAHAHVDSALDGRPPSSTDLPSLGYLAQVFDETVRLHPPAPLLARVALAGDHLGEHQVPPGTTVLISPWLLHHHPRYWDEPEAFLPERFDESQSHTRPPFTYLPFSGGPRHCLGERFARQAATIILSMIMQRAQLQLIPGQRITTAPLLTNHISGKILFTLRPRVATN